MNDKFICPSCESVTVIRPTDCDRPIPQCLSCSVATGGVCEMVWLELVK